MLSRCVDDRVKKNKLNQIINVYIRTRAHTSTKTVYLFVYFGYFTHHMQWSQYMCEEVDLFIHFGKVIKMLFSMVVVTFYFVPPNIFVFYLDAT